ncbi:VOC family protein [Pararhodobacter zhoushanensis]|uniref:VOC family protein n=1 Tax=Pararhodobacter zhoushanensis TaxID=2479545 RepID=UPI000F8CF82E|nr:VOC family protein [Pararhodobacter zhoushanensis]
MRPTLDRVLETAVYVDDLDTAEAFYAGVLGLEIVLKTPGQHVFFRCGRTIVLTFLPGFTRAQAGKGPLPVPPHGAEGAGHICFAAEGPALDHWASHLRAAGVAIEADFRWPNGARSIYVRDPAGNSVEFAEPKLWEIPA